MAATNVRLALEAWETFHRAHATVFRDMLASEVWGEISANDYGVLYALSQASDGLRMTELQEDALLSQAGISRLVGRLERRGLITRTDDPKDGRACRLSLTEQGSEVQRRVGAAHARHITRIMTAALQDSELETLRRISAAIIDQCPTASAAGTDDQESEEEKE